jgi:predicted DNA-binding protein YlxM (UPF0122 family)
MRDRQNFESERGVTQALALAAKDGKPIPFNTQAEIAEKWGVPLNTVLQRAKAINENLEATNMKQQLHAFYNNIMTRKKADPGWQPTEKNLMMVANELRINDPRVLGMAKDAFSKIKDQKKIVPLSSGQKLVSIGENNEASTILEADPKEPEKDKSMIKMQRKGRKASFPAYMVAQKKKQGWTEGQTDASSVSEKDKRPPFYIESMQNALDAINKGADRTEIFKKLQKEYPTYTKEMQTILGTDQMPTELREKLKESVERVNAGKAKKTDEYRLLAEEYPEHQEILKKILITPPDEDTFSALLEILGK